MSETNDPKAGDRVEIFWVDSQTQSGWMDADDTIKEACVARTVGILVSIDETTAIVCQNQVVEHEKLGEVIAIPMVAVQAIEVLSMKCRKYYGERMLELKEANGASD